MFEYDTNAPGKKESGFFAVDGNDLFYVRNDDIPIVRIARGRGRFDNSRNCCDILVFDHGHEQDASVHIDIEFGALVDLLSRFGRRDLGLDEAQGSEPGFPEGLFNLFQPKRLHVCFDFLHEVGGKVTGAGQSLPGTGDSMIIRAVRSRERIRC